jgi:hypothetical protein
MGKKTEYKNWLFENNINNNLLTDEMQADKKPITMRDGDIVNKFKY